MKSAGLPVTCKPCSAPFAQRAGGKRWPRRITVPHTAGAALLALAAAVLAPAPAWSTSVAWDLPGGGFWQQPTSWSPAGVPNAGDDVFINTTSPTPFTVSLTGTPSVGKSETVKSVSMSSPNSTLQVWYADLNVTDTFGMTAGTLSLRGTRPVTQAYLHADNGMAFSGTAEVVTIGNVRLGGDISNSGNMDFTGGVFLDGTGATGIFDNSGTVRVGATGNLERISHATLNSGTFVVLPGQADVNGFTNLAGGTLRMEGGRLELTNRDLVNRGTVEMVGTNATTIRTLPGFSGAVVNEAGGLIDVQSGATRTINNRLDNAGLLRVGADLEVARGGVAHVNSGRVNLADGSTLQISGSGASLTNTTSGLIDGNGTLDVNSIDFIDNGTLSPGNSFGRIEILGDYVQGIDGILDLEIGATSADELLITGGTGTFNGTLRLSFVDGFAPALDDIFDLVTGDILANFSAIEFLGIEPGFLYDLAGGAGGLRLTALSDAVSSGGGGIGLPAPATLWLGAPVLFGVAWSRRRGCTVSRTRSV